MYAIGAPQGLELSLSEGLVSGLRKDGGTTYIQTTAAISKGSSGGGLFDAQGRLVGITTMYVEGAQALNFAVPAEQIASVPELSRVTPARSPVTRAAAANVVDEAAAAADAAADAAAEAAADTMPARRDSRWMYVTKSSDGGVVLLDRKTVRSSGSDVTAWWKIEYRSP